mgnify:CR=1 FL=1
MEITFEKEYLSGLYYKGKTSDKKHRFQPEVIKSYKLRIEALESADCIEDLFQINTLHYEAVVRESLWSNRFRQLGGGDLSRLV